MKKLFIKCKTVEEKYAAFYLLGAYDYKYIREDTFAFAKKGHNHLDDVNYMGIMADPSDKDVGIYRDNYKSANLECFDWDKDLTKIVEFLAEKKVAKMQLTSEYKATVTKDGVQVGCQLITFSKLDELVKLTKDFR